MAMKYVLKPAILGSAPEITITEQEYLSAARCHKLNYQAFEIELAFDFVVASYIEIEKYVAEHLVLDMAGQTNSVDAMRAQQWGFMRIINSWLASISLWRDITRGRLISICGRGKELKEFEAAHSELQENEFVYGFIFQLRNYSQHGGFPITSSFSGARWDTERTQLSFSASYNLDYDQIRPYFEGRGTGAKKRKAFGKRIEDHSGGKPFDLKPIVRQSMGIFGMFMDRVRASMAIQVTENETLVLDMIDRFRSENPGVSIIGLSVMRVNENNIVSDKADIISVRDEFILRSRELRKKNNTRTLSMDKRIISNA